MTENNKEMIELDHIFELFCNQSDCSKDSVIKACRYFVEYYDFDVTELPDTLHQEVSEAIAIDRYETYCANNLG